MIATMMEQYRTLAGDFEFQPNLEAKARWIARYFFQQVVDALGRPEADLAQLDLRQVLAALSEGVPLPPAGARPEPALTGQSVSLGRVVGRVRVVVDADEGAKIRVGDVLVSNLSTPDYEGGVSVFPYREVPAVPVQKAGSILTDEGGLLSHAAIICRENRVPSILGTERGTELLKDGMIVEVDATRAAGKVWILEG